MNFSCLLTLICDLTLYACLYLGLVKPNLFGVQRFGSDASTTVPKTVAKSGHSAVSVFFQRVTSFIVGAGVTALGTQFYIHQELVEANQQMLKKQKQLEDRLGAIEKKF